MCAMAARRKSEPINVPSNTAPPWTSLSGARKLIYRTSPRGNFVRFRQTPLDATDSAVLA
jgi:hypothetical protein